MSDDKSQNSGKPARTLADFIPDEPKPEPKRSGRRKPTRAEAERLEALERAVRDTKPDAVQRKRKKSRDRSGRDLEDYYDNKGWKTKERKGTKRARFVFWAIVIMMIVAFLVD